MQGGTYVKRLICLLICLMLLTGCAQEQAYTPTGDALEYGEDYTGPTVTAPQPETVELTLTWYPDRSLNPFLCTDFTNQALFSLLYQGLFSMNRNYGVEPVLCKNYQVSQDMKTYTFYLENAIFSDGTRLTATDVIASYQAAKASKVYGGLFMHILSVTEEADGSVVITLDTPYEDLPLILDIPIIPAGQEENDFPAGTGPYRYADNCLRKQTSWWCKASLPINGDTIPLITATSPLQIRDNFQFGGLDLVCADPGSDRYADYRCDYELWDSENGIFVYLAFCANSEVFEDPELRAAITYAVDRDTLAATEYRGFARSASLPASPLFPYYSTTLAERYRYNPEKFAEVVEARGATGKEVVFLVNSDDSLRLRVARTIAQALTDGGLKVTLTALKGSAYIDAVKTRQFDLYLGQTRLSANMDLSPFFHMFGALSYGGVDDIPAYTLCLDALANHGNYYTLHKTVMDEGLLCPVVFRSYSIYATRGLISELNPSRDNVFRYSLGKTMAEALIPS